MNFKKWLENNVLAHIAGASGSGKTTLGNKLANLYSGIIVKDLDEFDDEAERILGWSNIKKNNYIANINGEWIECSVDYYRFIPHKPKPQIKRSAEDKELILLAKKQLMRNHRLTEHAAYGEIRSKAMNYRCPMVEIAKRILKGEGS